jgi:hypothetical protein
MPCRNFREPDFRIAAFHLVCIAWFCRITGPDSVVVLVGVVALETDAMFFGFSKEVLKDPQENVRQGASQYPWSVTLIRGISGYLFIFGSISLIIMIYLIVKFFLDCF